jgi:hypothetical protein
VSLSYPFRFFHIVSPLPSLIVWTFVVIVSIGAVAIGNDPATAPGAMVPVLLLQLFAASSGFEVPARRGHYDLLLTSGCGRVRMALVHWASSVAPGLGAWLVLAGIEAAASNGAMRQLTTTGTWAAVWLISTLPWAITVRLPRFSGGIGWLLALAVSTTIWPGTGPSVGPAGTEHSDVLSSAWSFLVYPPMWVGHELHSHDLAAAAPALLVAGSAMVVACRWVSRTGVPLEAAQ